MLLTYGYFYSPMIDFGQYHDVHVGDPLWYDPMKKSCYCPQLNEYFDFLPYLRSTSKICNSLLLNAHSSFHMDHMGQPSLSPHNITLTWSPCGTVRMKPIQLPRISRHIPIGACLHQYDVKTLSSKMKPKHCQQTA